jgi:hypothetical protein
MEEIGGRIYAKPQSLYLEPPVTRLLSIVNNINGPAEIDVDDANRVLIKSDAFTLRDLGFPADCRWNMVEIEVRQSKRAQYALGAPTQSSSVGSNCMQKSGVRIFTSMADRYRGYNHCLANGAGQSNASKEGRSETVHIPVSDVDDLITIEHLIQRWPDKTQFLGLEDVCTVVVQRAYYSERPN